MKKILFIAVVASIALAGCAKPKEKEEPAEEISADLTVSPTTLNFTTSDAGSKSFNVTSNVTGWTVTSNQTWATVSPATGSNNAAVTVNVTANTTTTQRTATITVKGRDVADRTVTVMQAGNAPDEPYVPVLSGNVGPRPNTYDDPANGIYVSPSGNDATGNGSIDKPYKTINKALENAQSGATIVLRGGKYPQTVATRVREPNITIKSRKGEWAIIEHAYVHDTEHQESGVMFDPEASGCKLQAIEVIGGFYAVTIETKWGWNGDDDWMAASKIIIEDCILHDSKYDVVKVKPNCNNVIIRYNEIYNSGRYWVKEKTPANGEDNAEGIDNVQGNKMSVHNNYIHDCRGNGIYAKGGAVDVIIENNRIERINAAGIQLGFDTSPAWFDLSVNPKYYENIRGIARNNLIIDVGWEGIGLYASKDAQVYNNTIVNAIGYGTGLFHSPIYFGVATQDWDNPTGCPPNINPKIHHNIVSQPSTSKTLMIDIRYATGVYSFGLSGLEGKPTMNNNCYYIAGGKNATFNDNRQGSILENAGFAAWKTHISGETGSLEVNPSLNSDYMPTNAQCAGMGITLALTKK